VAIQHVALILSTFIQCWEVIILQKYTCCWNTSNTGTIYFSSSRGPGNDGRIKPEICALGEALFHVWGRATGYDFAWGTRWHHLLNRGLALLDERYKQLNGNVILQKVYEGVDL